MVDDRTAGKRLKTVLASCFRCWDEKLQRNLLTEVGIDISARMVDRAEFTDSMVVFADATIYFAGAKGRPPGFGKLTPR